MNVCTKCHGNPSNSCQDISVKTTNLSIIMVLLGAKFGESTKSVGYIIWER